MRRTRSILITAPALALVLTLAGAGCSDDGGDGGKDAPTEQDDSGGDRVEPGSQTNSDEGRREGEAPADSGGSDGGAGQSDGEDGSRTDEGGN